MKKVLLSIFAFILFFTTSCAFGETASSQTSSESEISSSAISESSEISSSTTSSSNSETSIESTISSSSSNSSSSSTSSSSAVSSSSTVSSSSAASSSSTSVAYEEVTQTLDFSALTAQTLTSAYTQGKFTIPSGTVIDSSSGTAEDSTKFNGLALKMNKLKFQVVCDGEGTLTFYMMNGSGSYKTTYPVTITSPSGSSETKNLPISGSVINKVTINVVKGTYTICPSGATARLYGCQTVCQVPVSNINGFDIQSKGTVNYLEGTDFDSSKLAVVATYESGKTDTLATTEYTVDSSKFNKSVPGVYDIDVTYSTYTKKTYQVTVYEATSLKLYDYYLNTSTKNTWTNGLYVKSSLKTVFNLDSDFNSTNLSVNIVGTHPTSGATLEFRCTDFTVDSSNYVKGTEGKYSIDVNKTVNSKSLTVSYDVYVIGDEVSKSGTTSLLCVDIDYTGIAGKIVEGYNTFSSIQQALDYISEKGITSDITLKIMNGVYNEKIDFNLPNMTVIGESEENTIIEYDGYNGKTDVNGTSYSTDGSASVTIRDTAKNFVMKTITIRNYYYTLERFTALKTVTTGTQNVALLVQADGAIFYQCSLISFQDTLELQGCGRQYFNSCLIAGATDFIFGSNSSALFESCEIKVIGNGQSSNGGYITAPKGNNSGSDQTNVGYIFNNCNFTNDGGTTAYTTAICRPWADYAKVTVMNSTLASHISKSGYVSGTKQGLRYVTGLSSSEPTTSTVHFSEYNNTGDGAISTAVNGMTMLTETSAQAMLDSYYQAYSIGSFSFTAFVAPTF